MLSELTAQPDIRGHRIDIAWTWRGGEVTPPLRLLRRRRAYPEGPENGLTVLDVADHFRSPNQPWARIERNQYLVSNSVAEGGLLQAEIRLYYASTKARIPARVRVSFYDSNTNEWTVLLFNNIGRFRRQPREDSAGETLEIFTSLFGAPPESVGQIEILLSQDIGVSPSTFQWIAPGEVPVSVEFDEAETEQIEITALTASAGLSRTEIRVTRAEMLLRTTVLEESLVPDPDEWEHRTVVQDTGLEAEQVYYYGLFEQESSSGAFLHRPVAKVSAMATGRYGLDERLYALLPGVHRYYDEPEPALRGQGQLRGFLQIFGASLDQVRSLAEGLRIRHDVQEVSADRLPSMARWIGWKPDHTLGALALRNDIRFAPEVYATLGTLPNIRSLVNRTTGWDCQVKEFVHNIFLTADTRQCGATAEPTRLWEIWQRLHDGTEWEVSSSVTRTDGFNGRPAAVTDAGGASWLFWHGDQAGRREIWVQQLEGSDAVPIDDGGDLPYVDEYPATVADADVVWLFWSSNRGGAWDVWFRSYGEATGEAVRLTQHQAEDRNPAAVRDADGHIWVFFQSNRRGPTDIWTCEFDGAAWGPPVRVTGGESRDELPAAVLDGAGRLWLFWCADDANGQSLFAQVCDLGVWSAPQQVTAGLWRDEAPAAVFWREQIWLFWHSNRTGRWQIWGRTYSLDTEEWDEPIKVTTHPAGNKEPAALVTGGGGSEQLRLFWRSQRGGERYRSRTIDTNDPEMLANLGTFEDRAHYTYDCGKPDGRGGYELDNDTRYQRGTVGLFIVPDVESEPFIMQEWERVSGFLADFLPVNTRAVFVVQPAVPEEHYDTRGILEEHTDLGLLIQEETYDAMSETAVDRIPGWHWFVSNDLSHRTVDTTVLPVDTRSRTWHIGLSRGD